MHRAEILDAAERVFVRDGYQGATIERIAQEAQFGVGTLYNFFEGKQQLFEEVVTKRADDALAALEASVLSEPDPLKAFEALVELRLTFPHQHRDFSGVFYDVVPSARANLSGSLPGRCQELYDRYLSALVGIIRKGGADGVFRNEDPLYLALGLEGALHGICFYWIQEDPAEPLAERVAKAKRVLAGMMLTPQDHRAKERAP